MPTTINSCFPKMKRPQDSSSGEEDRDHPVPIFRKFTSLYSSSAAPANQPSNAMPFSPDLQYGSTPDLSALYASSRFFISSPGKSNSIITDSLAGPSASSSSFESYSTSVMKNSVAVFTHSPDPYTDFRRSMEEMVEAREHKDNKNSNWEYLHELLLCYLALNPKTTHKFIIGAFSDLVVDRKSAPAVKRTGAPHRKANGDLRYKLK